MTDDNRFDISRRKVLGSLGAVGAGAALGGAGTTAFFSDKETVKGNKLTAGELDLKLAWQEHYSDWSADEAQAVSDIIMLDSNQTVPSGYVGLPTAADPLIAIPDEDLTAFMQATALEAYPDNNNDRLQDSVSNPCQELADMPGALSEFTGPRSENNDTQFPDGSAAPLINLDDVKPGDFGEVTFSLHLCDNPGYIWVNGGINWELTGENGTTEPESKDTDEKANVVELLDELMVALWYDHGKTLAWDNDSREEGDNVMQPNETAIEFENTVAIGSLRTVMDLLGTNDGLGIPLDGKLSKGSATEVTPVGSGTTVSGDADSITELACSTVDGNPTCADYNLLEAIKIEEGQLTTGKYATPAGTVTVNSVDAESGTVTISTDFPISAVITKGGPNATVCQADGNTNGTALESGDGVKLDNVTFETPVNKNSNKNYGISHIDICYEGTVDGGDGDDRDCFDKLTTAHIGFAWWLPVDHANEIQTDRVAFDLGFYTEQCRHNDGSGIPPE